MMTSSKSDFEKSRTNAHSSSEMTSRTMLTGRFTHSRLSRRAVMRAGAGLVAGATFGKTAFAGLAQGEATPATVTIPEPKTELPTDDVTFRLIDSGEQKAWFWDAYFTKYHEAHPNITVQYDGLPWSEIQKVVPLGIQNGTAHDVFNLPPGVSPGQAVSDGWVAPIDDIAPNFDEWKSRFPAGTFVEGINVFNGKTYGFSPTTNKRQNSLLLYNTAHLQSAGYDPSETPLTWDDFRAAAKRITELGDGQYYGYIIGGKQTGRWSGVVGELARMAGASSGDGPNGPMDWKTGEFVFTADEFIAAIELLLAMRDDGSVFPGSLSMNAPEARAQTPHGVAGMIIQGPWNIVNWHRDNPDFDFGVASSPVPNEGQATPTQYNPGGSNTLWVYAETQLPAVVGDVFDYVGSLAGQQVWGELIGIADPPIFPEVLASLELDPMSRRAVELTNEQLRLGPHPSVKNPETAQVSLELQSLQPDFGQVIQGLYTGQLEDIKAALQDVQDRADAELDRAIEAVRAKGYDVSRDDYVFENWNPAEDYTDEDYAELAQ